MVPDALNSDIVLLPVQAPSVVLAFVPPDSAVTADGRAKLSLMPFRGPLKYPYLAAWLDMASNELRQAACKQS